VSVGRVNCQIPLYRDVWDGNSLLCIDLCDSQFIFNRGFLSLFCEPFSLLELAIKSKLYYSQLNMM
jgi:hypothetical protein